MTQPDRESAIQREAQLYLYLGTRFGWTPKQIAEIPPHVVGELNRYDPGRRL